MGIMSKIKKRLPVVGGNTPPPGPASAGQPVPRATYYEEEPASARGDQPVREFLESFVADNKIVLFMKGEPTMPQCGFSARAVSILLSYGKPLAHFNVLEDGDVREGVKDFSNWPTIPQVYIGGEFLGGSDILAQMHDSGELKQSIDEVFAEG